MVFKKSEVFQHFNAKYLEVVQVLSVQVVKLIDQRVCEEKVNLPVKRKKDVFQISITNVSVARSLAEIDMDSDNSRRGKVPPYIAFF